MNSINWCKKQKKGIKLIEPNDNLSEEYFKSAEKTVSFLNAAYKTHDNMWLSTTKYYAEYFAVYSICMKIGIKCEIHECTLSVVKLLEEQKLLREGIYELLEEDKELRIDNQYYLKNREVKIDFDELSEFLLEIKKINESLNEEKISKIRNLVESD